jgi:UDP-2,4-diacetamido-2,4,6-trideoxy-beta-L-altropyranose hydrolase
MKIFFITEGGGNIGFGHITRCNSLYQAFEERGIIPEFIVNGDESAKELLKDKRCRIFNWLEDQDGLIDFIKDADIAIVDSYLADFQLYKKISEMAKVSVYIDDIKRLDYPKGIIISGVIYAEDLNYHERPHITYMLGARYAPLRKEFWEVPDKKIKWHPENIMTTFGGDDTKNMTQKVLRLLVDSYSNLIKKVIIGKGFRNIKEIENIKDDKTELIYYPDADGMKETMLESDIAISAGGQTLHELARIGVPTIVIATADNQINNIRGWQRAGFIKYAGWWEDENIVDNIKKNLKLIEDNTLREQMSKTGRTLIDGKGARRIVEEILSNVLLCLLNITLILLSHCNILVKIL